MLPRTPWPIHSLTPATTLTLTPMHIYDTFIMPNQSFRVLGSDTEVCVEGEEEEQSTSPSIPPLVFETRSDTQSLVQLLDQRLGQVVALRRCGLTERRRWSCSSRGGGARAASRVGGASENRFGQLSRSPRYDGQQTVGQTMAALVAAKYVDGRLESIRSSVRRGINVERLAGVGRAWRRRARAGRRRARLDKGTRGVRDETVVARNATHALT